MGVSPFTFYRGAALPMAADLAANPSTGIITQLCGDAHLSNFGLFASPERAELFDINDFDETLHGPFEWDLQRLAASLVVAGRSRGFAAHDNRHAVHRAMHSYRARMIEYAAMRAIDVYYASVSVAGILTYVNKRARPMIESAVHSAAHHDALHDLSKLTAVVDGKRVIVDRPPVIVHRAEVVSPLVDAVIVDYRESLQEDRRVLIDRYEIVDIAMKVVGVGSVGLVCAIGLFFASEGDVLFLQVKQVRESVLEAHAGGTPFASHGERVVVGQRLMQAASDIFLGHMVGVRGRHFYVRQLRDVKVRPMVEVFTPANMRNFARNCAWALARAHARSGDPAVLAGYIGGGGVLADAIATFAVAYAEQNLRDHALLVEAVRDGRVEATFED